MSYSIDYNPDMRKRYPAVLKRNKSIPIRPLIVTTAAVVIVYGIVSSGVLYWLIPGDRAVTTAAFSGMVEQIGEGERVRDAFLTFCKEIIVDGP